MANEQMASSLHPSRICYVGLMHRADDQRFVHKQCAALVRAGHDVRYFAIADQPQTLNGVKIYPLPSIASKWKRFLIPFSLLPKLLREHCRLYHLVDPEWLAVGFILKLCFKRQVLFDAHEDYFEYASSSNYVKWPLNQVCASTFGFLLSWASRVFDGFVFGDDSLAKDFPALGRRKMCFHHFPLLSMFPPSKIAFAERKYDLVHCGGLSQAKGAFEILEAVKILKNRCGSLRVLLIGQPVRYIEKQFYQYIRQHNLGSCLEITGQVPYDKVSALLDHSKVGAIPLHDTPKYQKQSSTKIFEYMAKKIPVVSSDLPPERKYMTSGVHGYLVPPQDSEAIADAVYKIITKPKLGQKMADACRKHVTNESLYAEKECEELIQFYDYILANPRLYSRKDIKNQQKPAEKCLP